MTLLNFTIIIVALALVVPPIASVWWPGETHCLGHTLVPQPWEKIIPYTFPFGQLY